MSHVCSRETSGKLKCGACLQEFPTLCLLHEHFIKHNATQSYHYDHGLKTAFPKYDCVCSATQTTDSSWLTNVSDHPFYQEKVSAGLKDDISSIDTFIVCHDTEDSPSESYEELETVYEHTAAEELGVEVALVANDVVIKGNATVSVEVTDTIQEQFNCKLETLTGIDLDTDDLSDSSEDDLCEKKRKTYKRKPKRSVKKQSESATEQKRNKVKVKGTWMPSDPIPTTTIENPTNEVVTKGTGKSLQRTCPICNKVLRRENYKGHIKKHRGELDFVCDICGSQYSSRKVLKFHQVQKHSKIEDYHVCEYCDMRFPTLPRLKAHQIKHTDSLEYMCKICEKKFRWKKTYLSHMKYGHTETRLFECNLCQKTFKWKGNYRDHLRSHTLSLPCLICGARFNTYSSFARHQKTHDKGVKPHVCHICGRDFIQKTPFWSHMEKHHDLTKAELIEMFPEKHGSKQKVHKLKE